MRLPKKSPLPLKNGDFGKLLSLEELKAAWMSKGYIDELGKVSSQFNKPIIFTEIGYSNMDGVNKQPANFWIEAPIDLQEQADCYQAAFEVLLGKFWLKGIFWWQWSAASTAWPENPQGKPAEEVLKSFTYRNRKKG